MVTTRRSSRAALDAGNSTGQEKAAPHQNGSGSRSRARTSTAMKERNSKGKRPTGVIKPKPTSPIPATIGIDDVVTVLRDSLATGSVSRKSFLLKDIPRMAGEKISPEVFQEIYHPKYPDDCGFPNDPNSPRAVKDRWDSACCWELSQLLSAWSSLGHKISALASLIMMAAKIDKMCYLTLEWLRNWSNRKLEQKNDGQVRQSGKQMKWLLEAFIWQVVLEYLEPRQRENGNQTRIVKAWNAWIEVYDAIRCSPPDLLSEVIQWRSASMRLFFATQGPLPAEPVDDHAILKRVLGAIGMKKEYIDKIWERGNVPWSRHVKGMADQVARQAVWVTTFMLGLKMDCQVTNLPTYSPNETSDAERMLVKFSKAEGEDAATHPVRLGLRMCTIEQDDQREETDGLKEWWFEVPALPQKYKYRAEDER